MALSLIQPRNIGHHPGRLPPDRRPFNIIKDYLEDRLLLAQAVERLTLPVEYYYDLKDSDSYDDENYDNYDENYDNAVRLLVFTWATFNSIVEQIPHDHDAHWKLAKLLAAIKSRDSPAGDDARIIKHEELWADLPLYRPFFRYGRSSPTDTITSMTARLVDLNHDTLGRHGGPDALCEQYTRQNALLARLIHLIGTSKYELNALMAFRWALEDDLNPQGLSYNVPGAAMWILHAGERIWKTEQEWVAPYKRIKALYMSRGSLIWDETKKNGFCVERWVMWRDSFGWVADMEEVCNETRELATLAYEKMIWIEENVAREIECGEARETKELATPVLET